jgi:O-antigen/teichoic acid export membrane protein
MSGERVPPSLSHRVARGALSTFGAALLTRAIGMAQSIAVARLLDPYRVGLFAIVSYVLSLAGALSDLGIPVAVIKLTAEYRASRPHAVLVVIRRVIKIVLGVSLAVSAALFLGADRFAALYREPSLGTLFRLAALALVLAVLGGFRGALLQGFQQIHRLAALGVVNGASMLALTLVLLPWLGLPGIILASIVTECLGWTWTVRPLRRAIAEAAPGRPQPWRREGGDGAVESATPLRARVFHLAAPSFLNGVVLFGAAWFVRSWLARAQGYEAVGLFQIADSVARALMIVSGAIAVPLVPAVAEVDATGSGRLGSGLQTVLRGTLFVTLPAAIFLALAGGPLIGLVFGAAYAGAGPITAWLAVATLLQAATNVFWSAQVGTGRIWAGFGITAAGQAVLVAGALLAVPVWGLVGLGAAVLLGQAVALGLAARDVTARLEMRLEGVRALVPAAAGAFALVAALFGIGAEGLVSAILVAGAMVLGEAFLLWPSERRLVREMALWATTLGARRA